jgi:hypothetical protein
MYGDAAASSRIHEDERQINDMIVRVGEAALDGSSNERRFSVQT